MLRLRFILPLLLVLVAALPAGIISSVLLKRVYTTSSEMKQQELSRALDSVVENVNSKFAIFSTSLQMFADDRALPQAIDHVMFASEARRVMSTFVERTPLINSVYLLSNRREVIDHYQGSLSSLEHSGAMALLQKALSQHPLPDNKQLMFEVRYPQPEQAADSAATTDQASLDYAIAVVTPLYLQPSRTPDKRPDGYLLGIIPYQALQQTIATHLRPDEAIELTYNGEPRFNYARHPQALHHQHPEDALQVHQQLQLTSNYAANAMDYQLQLYVPRWTRMEEVNNAQQSLTQFIIVLTICTLIIAYVLMRLAMSPFNALSTMIEAFRRGHYEHRSQPMLFQEYEQIRTLLEGMGSTIQSQLDTLYNKNQELMGLARLKDEYLHQLTALNDDLEQQVEEQTKELTHSLQRVEQSKDMMQRLLSISMRLQATTSLAALPEKVLEQLSLLVPDCGHAIYVRSSHLHEPLLVHKQLSEQEVAWLNKQLHQLSGAQADTHIKLAAADGQPGMQLFTLSASQYFGAIIVAEPVLSSELTGILTLFAKLTGSIAANQLLTAELRLTARTDELTRLGNRKAFEEELTVLLDDFARYPDEHIGLLIMDANGLKQANDYYGHEAGDKLLTTLAKALTDCSRRSDKAFRIGGDEFAILVRHGTRASCAELKLRLQNRQIYQQCQLRTDDGSTINLPVSFSIGAASTENTHPEQLFKVADEAMYEAKQRHHETQQQ